MKRSTDRILVTHVGSLARPPELIEMMQATDRGEPVDEAAYEDKLKQAVGGIVKSRSSSA